MKQVILIALIIFTTTHLFSQKSNLKEQALIEFKAEHYDKAISLLEKALEDIKDDAEIYYYLGFFNHYRAYDSRPLKGYDFAYSQKVFTYLDKAMELDSNYSDAKYFYGVECNANAAQAKQNYDLEKLNYFYKLAYSKGAFPDWLIEFGKNLLNSCEDDAILFTGGNADYDICSYLQLHQNYRKDVTIIPIGNIDRPWLVKFLKQGLEGGVKKINLSLTEKQILNMHPYKWRTTEIKIPVSSLTLNKYKLDESYEMFWSVEPDLTSKRQHTKIEGEEAIDRSYLSPQRAILLQIVEDNFKSRPIYFTNMCNPEFYGDLNLYFRRCGLVSELTPIKTKNTEFEIDYDKIEKLLTQDNFKQYSTILTTDIPRVSTSIFLYHGSFYTLAKYYKEQEQDEKYTKLKAFYLKYLEIGFNEAYEQMYFNALEK